MSTSVKAAIGIAITLLAGLLLYLGLSSWSAPVQPIEAPIPQGTYSLSTVKAPCFTRRPSGAGPTAYKNGLCQEVFLA
ncbi:hypothetical protein Tdes44962_MAKER09022 [Teratosphaeria destructans]|uniref:Uncharacterized protein n=1 Tax=Teratosphaeria destructans TaxID=418781 RepID=A0A9W7SUI7_9PEZI|nr:hypothetical protein Tdes44962_MAKER09022 [Teratosphaeria destructans]